jgi:hypothetical protein
MTVPWDLQPGDMIVNRENPESVDHCLVLGIKDCENTRKYKVLYMIAWDKKGNPTFFDDRVSVEEPMPDGYEMIR